jgi:hypothetical protein
MNDYEKMWLKIAIHISLIGIIFVFSKQTYQLARSINFTPEYKIFGVFTLLILLYYNYKLFEIIYKYKKRHTWHPSEQLLKELYEQRTPKKPIENQEQTSEIELEPITELIDVKINLDLDTGLYYGKNLNIEEKIYLINHKYQKGNFVPIGKTRQEECYVKTNNIESLPHTFLVENIKQEILKYTHEVKINLSRDPDIIFKNAKNEIVAIEIETGTGYTKHKFEFEQKFYEAKLRYKKNLYIVLTNRLYKQKYKKLFSNIKILLRQDIPAFLSAQFPQRNIEYIPAKHKAAKGRKKAEN